VQQTMHSGCAKWKRPASTVKPHGAPARPTVRLVAPRRACQTCSGPHHEALVVCLVAGQQEGDVVVLSEQAHVQAAVLRQRDRLAPARSQPRL